MILTKSPTLPISTQCNGKFKFYHFDTAKQALHAIIKREHEKGNHVNFTVYPCPHCGMYHVGKVP